MAEFELIERIRARCAVARDDVRLGIGDDAALLAPPPGMLLAVSTDTLVAGVHFPRDAAPADVGWKSLAVNLSDLAATAAEPAWATLAITLPQADRDWLDAFADGFAALARAHGVALVGGDTTQGPLSITITVHGFVAPGAALLRSGARPGDGVFVTGTLGDAAAGLCLLQAAESAADGRASAPAVVLGGEQRAALLARLNRPTPRLVEGLLLRGRASACIDVSDGLLADLGHVCAASRVAAEIELEQLPASAALHVIDEPDLRRRCQLAGGDDYELCFTADEAAAAQIDALLARDGCGATRVGRIVAGSGVRVLDASGRAVALPRAGWQHFA